MPETIIMSIFFVALLFLGGTIDTMLDSGNSAIVFVVAFAVAVGCTIALNWREE